MQIRYFCKNKREIKVLFESVNKKGIVVRITNTMEAQVIINLNVNEVQMFFNYLSFTNT